MIRSWRNSVTRKVWEGERPNQLRGLDFETAVDLLLALNVAKALTDLSPLKSVALHKLKGERKSFARTMLTTSRSSIIIRDENDAPCRPSGPSVEARVEHARTER
jgi:proteic killer suppression protein